MKTSRIAAIATVLAAIGLSLQLVTALFSPGTLPEWAIFESVGFSMMVYSTVGNIIAIGVTVAAAVGVGFTLSPQIDIPQEFRRLLGALADGSGIGVFGAYLILSFISPTTGSIDGATIALFGLSYLASLTHIGLLVILGVFAGVAFGHLSRDHVGDRTEPASRIRGDGIGHNPYSKRESDDRPDVARG